MKFKLLCAAIFSLMFITSTTAQEDKSKRKSPPATAEATIGKTKVSINYSRPSVKGRTVFGELVPWGKVWRTGANEATTFEVSTDVMVNGKKLSAGKYALFTIPGEKEWTIIINSVSNQWGAYRYKEDQDVLRVSAKSSSHDATEMLTISIDEKTGMVHIDWAETRVSFEVKGA